MQCTARVLGGSVRLWLGMVRTDRPWMLVVRLSRLLVPSFGPWRPALLSLLSVAAVTGTLVGAPGCGSGPGAAAEHGRLAWLTATLATVGGAVGAELEDDDAVRAAAYTRSAD